MKTFSTYMKEQYITESDRDDVSLSEDEKKKLGWYPWCEVAEYTSTVDTPFGKTSSKVYYVKIVNKVCTQSVAISTVNKDEFCVPEVYSDYSRCNRFPTSYGQGKEDCMKNFVKCSTPDRNKVEKLVDKTNDNIVRLIKQNIAGSKGQAVNLSVVSLAGNSSSL